jgi:hypothetical protein
MWSRYRFLTGRVQVSRKGSRGVFVPIFPIAIFLVRSAVVNCEGLLFLIPGPAGVTVRAGADAAVKALSVLMDEGFLVDVRTRTKNENVRVKVRMV